MRLSHTCTASHKIVCYVLLLNVVFNQNGHDHTIYELPEGGRQG